MVGVGAQRRTALGSERWGCKQQLAPQDFLFVGKRKEKNTKLPLRITNYLSEEPVVPPKHSNKAHKIMVIYCWAACKMSS